jgi:hypothetical protein
MKEWLQRLQICRSISKNWETPIIQILGLDKAAKWYGELFAITSDLDWNITRYAKCLIFIEKNDQA